MHIVMAMACACRVVIYNTVGAPVAVEGQNKVWVLKGADKNPEGFVKILQGKGTFYEQ